MIDRRLTDNHLHFYMNPERDIEKAAEQVHGISEKFLADKPLFKDITDELIRYLQGAELIIHNAPFDIGFLDHELRLVNKTLGKITDFCTVVDTLALARRKHPGQHNNLDALCRRYHVDNSNRDYHGALLDAELLAQVYLLMTGGQAKLFEASTQDQVNRPQKIRRLKSDRKPLSVIAATSDEQQAHDDFLKKLKEQGACVWLDEKSEN